MDNMQLPGETWRPIQDCPGYEVSNMGRVRSYFKQVVNHPHSSAGGWIVSNEPQRILAGGKASRNRRYWVVTLANEGSVHHAYIHDLVMRAFVGPKPKGAEVCHFDDNPDNNKLENLRYGTHKENIVDAIRNGTMGHGEQLHENTKNAFTEAQIRTMRELRHGRKITQEELAKSMMCPKRP